MGILLIDSVSLSPPYLIQILIHHPRTNSKKRALWTLCRNRYQKRTNGKTNTKTEQGTEIDTN
jgi:hypothetical protein